MTDKNLAPIAVDDIATTAIGTDVIIDILHNDSDPNGDPISIHGVPTALHGWVEVNADGTITYHPNPGYQGPDTITYLIQDPDGLVDDAQVAVTVGHVDDNNAPVAVDDTGATTVGMPVILDVVSNDTDADGDMLSVHGTPTSPDGTVVVNGDGTITFTPTAGFTGDATITYVVSDGNGGTDTGEAVVTVTDNSGLDGIVQGTDGDDVIDFHYTGDPHGDRVDHLDEILPGEGPNDDIILAGDGDDYVSAGAGDDDITGGDGSDEVHGGHGDDIIDTSGSAPASDYGWPGVTAPDADPFDDRDIVHGGAGNDTITTGDDEDEIHGGNGNDTIDGGLDDDTIHGGTGDDTIIGGHGSDTITGGTGDDEIWGGMGAGTDPFNVPDVDIVGDIYPIADPVPTNGIDVIHGGDGNDTIYGQDDADMLYGDDGNDMIDGGIDDDTIEGGAGDDTLIGGQGNDSIDGGTGNDTMSGGDDRDTFTNVNGGDEVDGGAGGDDYDVLDLRGSVPPGGSMQVTETGPDSNGNGVDGFVTYYDHLGHVTGTLNFEEIEEIIPCFTPGTMIATPKGERRVEELREGDKVITRDNGIQEIRWIGAKNMGWKDLAQNEHLRPVLIQAGSLGNGLPERDILVSPNHRVLVANDRTALYFEEREVLVAAKHLVDNKGVQKVDTMGTSYIHFMFDQHEVVLSNGAWTESFQPGDMSLKGIGNAQRTEIFELFPELEKVEGLEEYAAARRTLKKHEAKILIK